MENGHTSIPYIIRTSTRARHMRLSVHHDGNVVLTAPIFTSVVTIERFFLDKLGWIIKKREAFRIKNIRVLDARPIRDYKERKGEALKLVQERVDEYSKILGVTCRSVHIRNQKTRWGSCSRQGNISIHYRILDLPPKMQTYIIMHELCHLKEFNHSKRFWTHVESVVPEYRTIRKELRRLLFPR